jgi:hypothetical protein
VQHPTFFFIFSSYYETYYKEDFEPATPAYPFIFIHAGISWPERSILDATRRRIDR